MNVNFGSGTQEQQDLFMAVFGTLMNFPILDHVDADLFVDFVEDPAPNLHNEFAYTSGTDIEIKQDAPGFASIDPSGQAWGIPFFNEVVVHELCHALLSLAPSETLDALAALFGTTADDWSPLDQPWEDRPLEGICETFKDAFLPRRYRKYANRTNHKISISEYPEFRRIWRQGIANMGGEVFSPFSLVWKNASWPLLWSNPFVIGDLNTDFIDLIGADPIDGSYYFTHGSSGDGYFYSTTANVAGTYPSQEILLDHMRDVLDIHELSVHFDFAHIIVHANLDIAIYGPSELDFWGQRTDSGCGTGLPVGTERNIPIDADVQIIWKMKDGSFQAGSVKDMSDNVHWIKVDAGNWYTGSGYPGETIEQSEDFTWPIPDDAAAVAGFVHRFHQKWEWRHADFTYQRPFDGGPCESTGPALNQIINDYLGWMPAGDFDNFFTLPGFTQAGGTPIELPVPEVNPAGDLAGRTVS